MTPPITRDNRQTVLEFLAETHSGRLDIIDRTVSPTVSTHGFPGGDFIGRVAYKAWFEGFAESFTGMSYEPVAVIADAGHVAVHWRVSVSHTGPFAGIAPTGRRATFEGTALYRMEEGLIAETWLQPDLATLFEQLDTAAA